MSDSVASWLIHISQEAGKADPISLRVFHSLLWSTLSKALASSMKQRSMFFWNSLAFSMIQQMLAIWSLVPLPYLYPAWTSGSSQFTQCWIPACRILSHNLTSMRDEGSCLVFWTFFSTALLGNWDKDWPFPVLWPLLGFPNLLTCWVQHFDSIILKLCWNLITSTRFIGFFLGLGDWPHHCGYLGH